MSEKLNHHEHLEDQPKAESAGEAIKVRLEKHEAHHETDQLDTENLKQELEQAKPAEKVDLSNKLDATAPQATSLPPPSNTLKSASLNNSLSRIRGHLSGPDRGFSKLIHNPTISAVTEATGKTLARPYGLLTGGLFTLLGSGFYLVLVRRTGYKYNFFVPLLLFVGGFVVGIIVESLHKMFFGDNKS